MLNIKEYFNLNDLHQFIPEVQQKRQEQRRGVITAGQEPESSVPIKEVVDEDELDFQRFLKNRLQVGTTDADTEGNGGKGGSMQDVSFMDSEGDSERYDEKRTADSIDTLRIVGREENGEFLVIANQRGEKTILSMFSINLMHWITVHIWDQRYDIVSATVSPNRQTVGVSYRFTTQEKKDEKGKDNSDEEHKDDTKKTFYYSTFVQSVGVSQKFVLSENSTAPQKIQFLSEEAGKHTITYRFLHTTAGERIDVVGVTTDNTPPFAQTKKPWKMHRVSGPHLWAGIFSCTGESTNTLCTIEQRSPKGAQQCIRVIPLCADKPLKAQTEHMTADILSAKDVDAALENPTYGGSLLPYALNTPAKDAPTAVPLPSITALELPSGSQCVCIQHGFSDDAGSTRVTVIELESHLRMDFAVLIPADRFLNPGNVRVMFDVFADYLMMYIPGHYLHLLDLSGHHDPGLGVVSSTAVTRLPPTRSRAPQTPFVTAFGLGPTLTTSSKKRHFLDVNTGIVYEYSARRSFFIDACKTKDRYLQEALLHGAATHLGDTRLAQEMMSTIISENSAGATSQLFKEFILASTYVRHRISDQGQTSAGTPLTAHSLSESVGHLEKLNVVADVKVSAYDAAGETEEGECAPKLVQKKLWRKIGNIRPSLNEVARDNEDNDDNNTDDITARITVHGDTVLSVVVQLAAALGDFYPKITDKRAADAALTYMKSQEAAVSDLFATITIGMAQQKIRRRFCFLENFFCALDELGCVCTPPGFWTEFGTLGLLCLPQTVFFQYVERGRMRITKNFVRRVLFTADTKKSDPKLAYYFLSKFTVRTVLLLLTEAKKQRLPDFLVERSFNEDFSCTLGTDTELGEEYDNSRFIPVSLLLSSIEGVVEQERRKDQAYNPPLSEIIKRLDSDELFNTFKF